MPLILTLFINTIFLITPTFTTVWQYTYLMKQEKRTVSPNNYFDAIRNTAAGLYSWLFKRTINEGELNNCFYYGRNKK
jgi:hypothetical protein